MPQTSPPIAAPPARAQLEESVRAHLDRGDAREAAGAALRWLGPSVLRFMRSSLRDETLAGDAFSEFSEDLLRGLDRFRGECALRTWAYRIAWNAICRVRDDPWRRRRLSLGDGQISKVTAQIRTSTPRVLERRALILEKLRGSLSFEDQSLLALRIDQALPWTEIALIVSDTCGPVAPDALMKRFQRLKERLAEMARREGLLDR